MIAICLIMLNNFARSKCFIYHCCRSFRQFRKFFHQHSLNSLCKNLKIDRLCFEEKFVLFFSIVQRKKVTSRLQHVTLASIKHDSSPYIAVVAIVILTVLVTISIVRFRYFPNIISIFIIGFI